MKKTEIRKLIIDALEYANVLGIRNNAQFDEFLSGKVDFSLDTLHMDSLATMELCIAVELNCGVSIAPETLLELTTLEELTLKIFDEQNT